ncbi:MAG: PIN domain-containing protein [Fretibacterium sp.]|nr:PIN domain-containing protein [Fretibacterium sp.]
MVMFDANMILRYLLNDNSVMAERAEQYLEAGNVSVTIEVIAEVIYVLKGVYLLERGKIVDVVKDFLELVSCQEKRVLSFALDTFGKHNLDFVDCVLYAYNCVKDAEIATFDKQLLKLLSENKTISSS